MAYHVTGIVSAIIFLLSIGGLCAQLQFVWRRKRDLRAGSSAERPTAVLSVNQFVSSFLAFFVFFLYGLCLDPLDPYLVWPRLIAALLTLAILWEIWRDRRDWLSAIAFAACLVTLIGAPLLLLLLPGARAWGSTVSQALIVVATVVLAQGYLHQVVIIRETGKTGGVSARLHQFFFWKDVSTIVFAMTMKFAKGWPIMLLSAVSAITKLIILWHFRWVRVSSVAKQRRESLLPAESTIEASAGP